MLVHVFLRVNVQSISFGEDELLRDRVALGLLENDGVCVAVDR
jgi:hypothetical protein